jgi:cellulose synthase/poly-beta-1,6-N-acetylglucosamine synthase-like glycosyltransferase/peptidoglycan/xylan/chitin deacetylase (PgdA/CDA1 family)
MISFRAIFGVVMVFRLFMPFAATANNLFLVDKTNILTSPDLPPNTVVLTFDDGPSKYTPEILAILQREKVHATFFTVGKEALAHPYLDDIYRNGNEIGNHTYSHENMSFLPPWRQNLELGLNRLIIEAKTGHSSRLFRPPYQGSDALTPSSKTLIRSLGENGYITVGEDIDTEDWRKPGVDEIISGAESGKGGIILFHDGGGDRHETVEALPTIIQDYKSRGFRFITMSEAIGVSESTIMPSPSGVDRLLVPIALAAIIVYSSSSLLIHIIIYLLIFASFARMLLVIVSALIQANRKKDHYLGPSIPCTVLVPAYNEAAVIESCLRSILASDYEKFEVLVIDDGSKDATSMIASSINDRRLRVITKLNGGKASALNYGIEQARGKIVVAIDADTVFRADTLTMLVRHFQDPKVGAVSGNTRIVNRNKLITKLQSLEYIVGFNLDRRMGDLFDCITVVPGAIGAFRLSVLKEIGGFTFDTLAEDTDLTLSIKEAGYKIVYDAEAIGTMQAVWKHKSSIFHPGMGSLGMIGLPYLLFFQIVFPLFAPLFDFAVVIGLLSHEYSLVLISFSLYTLADLVMSGIALKLDGERLRSLWLLIPQRLIYRQLMYYVILKSFVNVLRGRLVGWGSLTRDGKHLSQSKDVI